MHSARSFFLLTDNQESNQANDEQGRTEKNQNKLKTERGKGIRISWPEDVREEYRQYLQGIVESL